MKKYNLTTKNGEVISKTGAISLTNAINYFAERKRLSTDNLLGIYSVKREK